MENEKTTITLSNAQWSQILRELRQLHGYHWNDDTIHADSCGSKALYDLEYFLICNGFRED